MGGNSHFTTFNGILITVLIGSLDIAARTEIKYFIEIINGSLGWYKV